MKAARLHAYGTPIVIEDLPTPAPGAGEILLRIASAAGKVPTHVVITP